MFDEDHRYIVYQLRRADRPQPFYVGKGVVKRPAEHFMDYILKDDSFKSRTILKARRENVEVLVEIILDGLTEKESLEYEKFFISAYGKRHNGTGVLCNITDGGDGCSGLRHSEETKEKIRQINLGKKWDRTGKNKPWSFTPKKPKQPHQTKGMPAFKSRAGIRRICEHCGIEVQMSNFYLKHGKRCSLAPVEVPCLA